MYDIAADSIEPHSGNWSAHIFSVSDSPSYSGHVARDLEIELVKGKKVKLSAWSKSKDIKHGAIFFVRIAQDLKEKEKKSTGKHIFERITRFAGIEEMPEWMLLNEERMITGTTDWQQHEITFDVPERASWLWFGMILSGTGKVWVDDFSYKIVGDLPVSSSFKDQSSYVAKPHDLDFERTE